MSAGPIGREEKGTPRRGVPVENEAVPGGGASERREETEPEKEVSRERGQGLFVWRAFCVWRPARLFVVQRLFAVQKLFVERQAVRVRWWLHGGCSRRFVVQGGSSSSCGARFVRRRQSAGVGVGAFGGGSVCVEETRAARIRGADGTQGKSPLYFFFIWVLVCVCREASSGKVELV